MASEKKGQHQNGTSSSSTVKVSVVTNDESSEVTAALYPISQPLATILRFALAEPSPSSTNNTDGAIINDDDDAANANKNAPAATIPTAPNNSLGVVVKLERESMEVALGHFVRNCFVAMDALFFSTPASQRNNPTFQHRLCIRISTSQKNKTLSITDLGTGMTRSDLINTLGVGTHLSSDALTATRTLAANKRRDDEDDDDDDDDDDDESSQNDTNY